MSGVFLVFLRLIWLLVMVLFCSMVSNFMLFFGVWVVSIILLMLVEWIGENSLVLGVGILFVFSVR